MKDATSNSSNTAPTSSKKGQKSQQWSSILTVVLVEGSGLLPMDDNGFSDPYVKFKLGNEKYKSKVTIQKKRNCVQSNVKARWLSI